MQNKKVKLSALLLLGIGLTGIQAQEIISGTGGNASGSGGSVSYTFGQIFYTTNTGTNGFVLQGVQQPFEISSITAVEETNAISLYCTAFPNPTSGSLILKVDSYNKENLWYKLYDTNGRLLENKKIKSNETSIGMTNLASATYFLKVIDNNKEIKTFKIIKK
jgi:hypothetical protein